MDEHGIRDIIVYYYQNQHPDTDWQEVAASAILALFRQHTKELERMVSGRDEYLGRAEDALKLVYRKHCLQDDSIGWDELDKVVHTALCELMGDGEYVKWVEAL